MIKAVLFDLDDTLVDAMVCHKMANRESFESFGYNYKKILRMSEGVDFLGKRVIDILRFEKQMAGIKESELPLKKLYGKREKLFIDALKKKAKLLPGALRALDICKRSGCVVAVVSSGTDEYIKTAIERFGMRIFVDFWVSGDRVERGKPFPDCYNMAYKMVKERNKLIKKRECLVVEDSYNGVRAAQKAGLRVLFIPSKYNKKRIRADVVLPNLLKFDKELIAERI